MKDYKALSKREFNKEAERFDSAKGADIYSLCKKGYSYLLDELDKEKFKSLLDVGCGTGNSIALLNEKYKDASFIGIDLAENMIKIAEKKKLKNALFIIGDSENMPFEDNKFDVIICKESFHHYPDVDRFFKESYRVLRKGGRLIIMDMQAPEVIRWIYNNFLLRHLNTGDVHIYNIEEVDRLFNSNRFRVESKNKIDMFRFVCCGRKI